jgi:hypothetical protein
MKRKRIALPGTLLFKWHIFVFVIFTISLWLSVLATITYSGNTSVPFLTYMPLVSTRLGISAVWGVVLLIHFRMDQARTTLYQRDYNAHFGKLYLPSGIDGDRLITKRKHGDAETSIEDEERKSNITSE